MLGRVFRLLATIAVVLAVVVPVAAHAADTLRRPAGAMLVPDRFLRSWDPITFFFDADAGPAKGGPEDHADRLVTMSPAHPGAYTWLDARTLQFRPAVAWPPMGRFQFQMQGRKAELTTLMAGLESAEPRDGQENLDPVQAITLRFRDPIDPDILARLVTIELRPTPGVDGQGARMLDRRDFEVKVIERSRPGTAAAYVVNLRHPIPWGTRAVLHLRLSPDETGREEQTLSFATAAPFQALRFGCPDTSFPAASEGVAYARERALRCTDENRAIHVVFSQDLAAITPVAARNLVRLSPQVDDLRFESVGNTLVVKGRFAADTLYRVRLEPAAIADTKGRTLAMKAASELYLSFPGRPGFVRWQTHDGIVERFGPQMVPLKARGVERVDMRIHAIDPFDRSLWPFPQDVATDDGQRPPGPGEEPRHDNASYGVATNTVASHIAAFGSPGVSELVKLTVPAGDTSASLGLNLRSALARLSGEGKPGHYLVGIRRLDSQGLRSWMRLQVTDLSLTAVEETDRVHFAVTSLATGQPVDGATIRLDVSNGGNWRTLANLTTDALGMVDWQVPGSADKGWLRRLVVEKGDDRLIIDPNRPPRFYAEGGWRDHNDSQWYTWLGWATAALDSRKIPSAELCHIFTERPIYRPDDAVHIKGYVRRWEGGKLVLSDTPATLVVVGPDGAQWRYRVAINEYGSFYHKFDAKTAATGTYRIWLEGTEKQKTASADGEAARESADANDDEGDTATQDGEGAAESGDNPPQRTCHVARFKKDAYRLPRFEVQLHAPQSTGLDAPFKVGLTSEYYAGGVVVERPVRWQVTQIPFNWVPKAKPGYVFSADSRFSGGQEFRASPVLYREGKTDGQGGAALMLDPTIEPTAQPRKYVVEATVVGDDDQTVTNTQDVLALPPFVLGLKVARFLEKADRIEPLVIVDDAQGRPLAGQKVTVRLMRRQWNSILQATDFTQGSAKYVTEVSEEKVAETTFVSGTGPEKLSFPIKGAGVFIVEVDSQDKLGRLQTVRVDLFAGGERPATWSRPPAEVFSTTPDKPAYAPGEVAKIVLQSPFQNARALAVVEDPSGNNDYAWVEVKNGYGTFNLPIKPEYLPRVPVHFVLMRGRIKGDDDLVTSHADLRKPATLAATQWVGVTPAKHTVKVDLDYPRKAQPGQDTEITVRLSDDQGKPLAGEATLWMVDQAVLALAKEARLDPLPQFIVPRDSRTQLRDTRNMAFGLLPLQEEPGGDEEEDGSPLERVTVRKNFTPVPLYEPSLRIGADGTIKVRVTLPDSLTNFKLRAKAVSGPQRLGFGTGDMQVRLPVLVQPALPRFVRPGDSFELTAIGRVVDGKEGTGRAQVRVKGLTLTGEDQHPIDWRANTPVRLTFPVGVPAGSTAPVDITLGVDRTEDGAKDAFQISLPVKPDRDPVVSRTMLALAGGEPAILPAVTEPVRAGTLERRIVVASRELAALAAGLDYLRAYPFGCTEQRISQVRANLAGKAFGDALLGQGEGDRLAESFRATQEWLGTAMGDNGLVGYWPGGRGYVTLTAWAVQLLVEGKAAGLAVDDALLGKLTLALKQSLRSDYRELLPGNGPSERAWALAALTAAGQGDAAYAAELARSSSAMTAEGLAQVAWALARSPATPASAKAEMHKRLWAGVVARLDQGREVYGGLQENSTPSPVVVPSETRSVAQILRASLAAQPAEPRNRMLADALLRLGRGDGWGSTNANAEAMLALTEWIAATPKTGDRAVTVAFGDDTRPLTLSGTAPLAQAASDRPGEIVVRQSLPETAPLAVWSRTSYLPQADGTKVAAAARGFAVSREQWKIAADAAAAPVRVALEQPGTVVELKVGEVVEDHVVVVNQTDRTHVAVVVPLAAGMEPLNPRLATAPPEARPSEPPTQAPTYVAFLDDNVAWFYDDLPKGTYHFRVRSRATVPGRFVQPAASARGMYDDTLNGNGNGALVVVTRP